MKKSGLALLLCATSITATISAPNVAYAQNTVPANAVYKDAKAPVEARVDDLLARMTLEEKVAQIITIWDNKPEIFDDKGEFDPATIWPCSHNVPTAL